MANAEAYHVKLNSNGFILVEGSYVKRSQQAFNPRFSTGDPGYGDLSFWQFIRQGNWRGGAGADVFASDGKYKESVGWSFISGKPKLSPGSTNVTVANLSASHATTWKNVSQAMWLPFKTGDQAEWCIVYADASHTAGTRTNRRAPTDTLVGIDEVGFRAMTFWQRTMNVDESGKYLIGTVGDTFYVFDEAWTLVYSLALSGNGIFPLVVPLTEDKVIVIRTHGAASGNREVLSTDRLEFTADTWTLAAELVIQSGVFPTSLCNTYAKDSSGAIYFAGFDENSAASDFTEQMVSAIGIITATDAANGAGAMVSEVLYYPDHVILGLTSVDSVIYIFAMEVINADVNSLKWKPVILKFPKEKIWEGPESGYSYSGSAHYQGALTSFHQFSRSETYFIYRSSLGGHASVMRLTSDDVVEEVCAIPDIRTAATDNEYMGVVRIGQAIYSWDVVNNRFARTLFDGKNTARANTAAKLILKSAKYGGNTQLIEKSLYAVTVELTQAIPAGESFVVRANGTEIGTITNADGTLKEIVLTEIVTGPHFTIQIEAPGNSTWLGELEDLSLRYVPSQFKKLAWGLAVRADLNQELINGQRETRTPAKIFSDLKEAWASNIPIDFVDTDGQTYKVIVTEFSSRSPLLADKRKDREAVIALELLEV